MYKCYEELNKNLSESIDKVKDFFDKYKKTFFTIFLIGIIVHLFAITNKLLNWDECSCLFSKGGTYKLGRWLLKSTNYIFPNYSMPAFNGIISLFFVACTVVLIIDIFKIKSSLNRILIGSILITFPTLTCTMTYMFTVHSYMLSMFLSVLCVYFARGKKITDIIIAIILLVCSVAIYQSYISITGTVMLIILIQDCFSIKETKKIIVQLLKFLLVLLISLILYAILNKIIISILRNILIQLSRNK